MRIPGIFAAALTAALVAGNAEFASAQTQGASTPHVQLQKTIGQGKPDIVPSLIVMNSRGATLQGGELVLTGMSPNSIIFADRPVRSAGHDLTSRIIEDSGHRRRQFRQGSAERDGVRLQQGRLGHSRRGRGAEIFRSSKATNSPSMSRCWKAISMAPTVRPPFSST